MFRYATVGLCASCLTLACALGCGDAPSVLAGEGEATHGNPSGAKGAKGADSGCPARAPAETLLPGTRAEQQTLAYWLARYEPSALDAELLGTGDIEAYNAALGKRSSGQVASQRDLLEPVFFRAVRKEAHERLSYLRERLEDGRLGGAQGEKLAQVELDAFKQDIEPSPPSLHVALDTIALRCGPIDHALFEPGSAKVYDRNACSAVRAQEPVRLLGRMPSGMLLAETRYARGFIAPGAALSPAITDGQKALVVDGERVRLSAATKLVDDSGVTHNLPEDTLLPAASGERVWLATPQGLVQARAPQTARSVRRSLTRRALLTTAFELLDTRYGFGDAGGGRDCSRLLMDLFESFGLALPRHSGWQAKAGFYTLDVSGHDKTRKLRELRDAAQSGAVLLAFSGHIMLHLGEREDGAPMVLHALGEYVRPCGGGKETVVDVQRVVVSDLTLGEGSSRKSLLDRVTSLVVLGKPPASLPDNARAPRLAPPTAPAGNAPCSDTLDARIFISPAVPNPSQPLRVLATATRAGADSASSSTEILIFDASGARVRAAQARLGGPPHSVLAELPSPSLGRYTVLFNDGDQALGCKHVQVKQRQRPAPPESEAVWEPRFRWERDTENVWSAFVELLFDDPPDDERTFQSLHELLRDPERNFLFNHFGQEEEQTLSLVPDCADLPFALRAYFSWKLRLPFGYRQCSRGRPGVPPSCGELHDNMMPREAPGDVDGFAIFVNRRVRSGVHSASGRTAPSDDATDLYPVALDRESLTPGTVYADPYGHVLLLTKWIEQGHGGPDSYGILIGGEAQPDNTVGRRRFSRGSFLFDPSTTEVGAGFKHFRPLIYDRPSHTMTALDNATLATSKEHTPLSLMQYQGKLEDFYERIDALINPKALDPDVRMRSLLDGFQEAVNRRALSIDLGEQFQREQGPTVIGMPIGHEVFETTGPWEDYSTPSRDLRLLIALDEVLGLPARIAARPERFALAQGALPQAESRRIATELAAELARRSFEYTRSDGTRMRLPLSAVKNRALALELAYNPNDCAELRWGAPEGSDEHKTCTRRAPDEQRARMERYRVWFHTRTRPPRGAKAP